MSAKTGNRHWVSFFVDRKRAGPYSMGIMAKKGVIVLAQEAVGVRVDRTLLAELGDLVEETTGYRPSQKELLDKAMMHDIEKIKQSRDGQPKKRAV